MKVAVIGTGYVGLVTGACLADVGHYVTCVDRDVEKIRRLAHAQVDIHEPGLENLVETGLQNGHLHFTASLAPAVRGADLIFIAVGTPAQVDGATDLRAVMAAADDIAGSLEHPAVLVIKSTVPVGTCHEVAQKVNRSLRRRGCTFNVPVVSNPEFLKEGAAIEDFTRPDRIIIGSDNADAVVMLRDLYSPFNRRKDKILVMDTLSAELSKYAANAMLATKISFMNEMANIAERVGADIEWVRQGIGSDPRIGYDFIYAGCGYGGSCFPKDIKSLVHTAGQYGYESRLLNAVDGVNEAQKHVIYRHLKEHFGNLSGRVVALWGLAFKPGTNDIREAPSRVLMELLWRDGVSVRAYDPVAMPEIAAHYGERSDLQLCANKEDAVFRADALLICTEWKEFRVPDYEILRQQLRYPVIVDGRNLYDPERMVAERFSYYGVGRGLSCRTVDGDKEVPIIRLVS